MGLRCGLESEDPEMSTLAHGVLIACMDFSVTREGSSGKPDAQAKSLGVILDTFVCLSPLANPVGSIFIQGTHRASSRNHLLLASPSTTTALHAASFYCLLYLRHLLAGPPVSILARYGPFYT